MADDLSSGALDRLQQRWRLRMLGLFGTFLAGLFLTRGAGILGLRISGFCLFKALVGLPCPACGITRSIHLAMRGDGAGSLAMHPLGMAVGLTLLVAVGYFALAWILAGRWKVAWTTELRIFHRVEIVLLIGLVLCWLASLGNLGIKK